MKTYRTGAVALGIALMAVVLLAGCDGILSVFERTGTVSLSLTDAPIADAAGVEGVFITIESIEYNLNDEWVVAEGFAGPQLFNLLLLTGGEVAFLDETEIGAGTVGQIRFKLGAPEDDGPVVGTPGSYIAIDPDGVADGDETDDIVEPLFVPSGSQSGYKATGSFDVPANGTVEITADFDVRKSVVYTGNPDRENGRYQLKPTIRLVVNNEAGRVSGDFTGNAEDGYSNYVVFAYEDDTYSSAEASATDPPFPNAVASGNAEDSDDDGALDTYMVAFLAAGTYDLVVAGVAGDGSYTVVSEADYADVEVAAGETTTLDINLGTE